MDLKTFFRDHIAPSTNKKRDKWIINKLLNLPAKKSILDVGAGSMPFKKYCTHLRYKSQDFGEHIGLENKGLKSGEIDTSKADIVSDITHIPVKNRSFDYVLCTEVFEHIPDVMNALKEMSRITKKGGHYKRSVYLNDSSVPFLFL